MEEKTEFETVLLADTEALKKAWEEIQKSRKKTTPEESSRA